MANEYANIHDTNKKTKKKHMNLFHKTITRLIQFLCTFSNRAGLHTNEQELRMTDESLKVEVGFSNCAGNRIQKHDAGCKIPNS